MPLPSSFHLTLGSVSAQAFRNCFQPSEGAEKGNCRAKWGPSRADAVSQGPHSCASLYSPQQRARVPTSPSLVNTCHHLSGDESQPGGGVKWCFIVA